MKRLTKLESKKHEEAVALVKTGKKLSINERFYVLENFNPSATNLIHKTAAFFTPPSIAREMLIETVSTHKKRVLDLGAGIGCLSFHMWHNAYQWGETDDLEIVCLEINPDYVEVGKAVLPEAKWICGDMFDQVFVCSLGKFDEVLSNPPYGLHPRNGWLHKHPSQYMAAEVAMKVAPSAVFLLLQADCPFQMSGIPGFRYVANENYEKFHNQTGIYFNHNCGIDLDPSLYGGWKNLSKDMIFEIVNISKEPE